MNSEKQAVGLNEVLDRTRYELLNRFLAHNNALNMLSLFEETAGHGNMPLFYSVYNLTGTEFYLYVSALPETFKTYWAVNIPHMKDGEFSYGESEETIVTFDEVFDTVPSAIREEFLIYINVFE